MKVRLDLIKEQVEIPSNENTKLISNQYNTAILLIYKKMKNLQADCSLMVNRTYQTLRKCNAPPYLLYIIGNYI